MYATSQQACHLCDIYSQLVSLHKKPCEIGKMLNVTNEAQSRRAYGHRGLLPRHQHTKYSGRFLHLHLVSQVTCNTSITNSRCLAHVLFSPLQPSRTWDQHMLYLFNTSQTTPSPKPPPTQSPASTSVPSPTAKPPSTAVKTPSVKSANLTTSSGSKNSLSACVP